MRIAAADLQRLAEAIFVAEGVGAEHARIWAEVLVWANLRGVDSHGVLRIPRYLEQMAGGFINPRPALRLLRAAGAIALLDADRAPGPVAMQRAMAEAIDRARAVHVGWCVARNITHAGAVGHFALQAAAEGMAGLVMTASIPLMAWPGSKGAVVSTNPIAIAMPAAGRAPLLIDLATSAFANGKVMAAKHAGTPVPQGWGLDAEGRDTTDAARIATLLPLGAYKGAGLSLMIECLTSIVAMNPVIAPALRGELGRNDVRMNGVAIAVDLAAFGEAAAIEAEVAEVAARIAAAPRAPGVDALSLPGERGDAIRAERLAAGIPLPQGTWTRLAAEAEKRGIALPPATPR